MTVLDELTLQQSKDHFIVLSLYLSELRICYFLFIFLSVLFEGLKCEILGPISWTKMTGLIVCSVELA